MIPKWTAPYPMPKPGDRYFDDSENPAVIRTITAVGIIHETGISCQVTLDNGVGYDCYWHPGHKMWNYWSPEDQ